MNVTPERTSIGSVVVAMLASCTGAQDGAVYVADVNEDVPAAVRVSAAVTLPVVGTAPGNWLPVHGKAGPICTAVPIGAEVHCVAPLLVAVRESVPDPTVSLVLRMDAVKPASAEPESTQLMDRKARTTTAAIAFLSIFMRSSSFEN
jgi:hypothetical protein